ncbi:MAG: hypothetical protein K0S08_985 [Gammaproteobacteria bacterium]|jgi:uncharacterized protein YjbJ (UPF0337 family)|nr:hypothetical protein [Gammaproteobacteria bacterium]
MINQEQIQGNWQQFKGHVKEHWAKLTDDDLLECEGDSDQIIGKLTERYGISKDKARAKWDKFLNRFDISGNEIKSVANNISDVVENITDRAFDIAKDYQKIAHDRPFTTLGVAALTGIVIGLLISKS